MTYIVERLAELRRHATHLLDLRAKAREPGALERDLSLHNDVLFSLLMVSQLVIDIAGELSARRGDRFEDDMEAIRTLGRDARFPADLVRQLEPLAGFRNVCHPRIRRLGSGEVGPRRYRVAGAHGQVVSPQITRQLFADKPPDERCQPAPTPFSRRERPQAPTSCERRYGGIIQNCTS
jgi:uncharacterized protein YutE (UPF0331/DUF86 family)